MVVLLHGGTIPSWCFDAQISFLNARGFKTLRYDMFGRGGSAAPRVAYDRSLYVSQLEELLAALKVSEPFYLVGTSFGGAIASQYTLKNAERVRKLILLSPAINWISHQPVARLLRLPVLGKAIFELIGKKRVKARALAFMDALDAPVAAHYKKLFLDQTENEGFWRSLFSQLNTNALDDYGPVFEKLTALGFSDVELLWGAQDTEITREDVERLLKFIPDIRFSELSDSGHAAMAETPEKINEFILKALV